MDPQQLIEQIIARKWVAVAALIIGLIVRLLKSDTKIPIDIPPRLRAPLAIGLGALAGVLDKFSHMDHVTWTTALLEGVTAAVVAMVMHSLVIESARDGKELVVPGLIKENTPPGPGKPPSIGPQAHDDIPVTVVPKDPPMPMLRSFFARSMRLPHAFFGVIMLFLVGCGFFTPARDIEIGKGACIIANAFLNSDALNTICHLLTPAEQQAGRELSQAHRAKVAEEMKAARAEACAPDAGPMCSGAGCDGGVK